MSVMVGVIAGFVAWFVVRYLVGGLYTVDQNERAVKTVFGRASGSATAASSTVPSAPASTPKRRSATPTHSSR